MYICGMKEGVKREYTKEEQDMLETYIKRLALEQELISLGRETKRSLKRKNERSNKVKLKTKKLN